MTGSEDSKDEAGRKKLEDLERLFGHPFPQTEAEEKYICRILSLEVALNYFLMRDRDKPQNWKYSRDEAEVKAREWLGDSKPFFQGVGLQSQAEGA